MTTFLTRLLQATGRVLRALLGLALLVGLLLLGLAVATGLLLWAAVRGRRPANVGAAWRGMGPAWAAARGRPAARHATGEVVDAEVVREVTVIGR